MKFCSKNLLLFILIFSANVFSQDGQLDSVINKGIKQIYNLHFTDAEKTFRDLISDYPNHPAGRFFLAMVDWWKILIDVDVESYDDIFFQKLEDVIFQCDNILKTEPENVDALFFKGGAVGFRGRLRALRESWLKAVDDGREALPIVQKASKIAPNNFDVMLGFGIYNYYAAVIPDLFPLVKPLMFFFPSGDKAKGIQQLKATAMSGKYAKYEAQYFLMTLYYHYENDAFKAEEFSKMLYEQFPDNSSFERWRGRIAVRRGDNSLWFKIFSDVMNKCIVQKFSYNDKAKREAAYYLGLYYKNNFIADSALAYFEMSEKISVKIDEKEPSGFLINTVLYVGMMNDLLGKREKAIEYYNKVLDMREFGSSKTFANKYLEIPFKKGN